MICPFCKEVPISGIEVFPMNLELLEQAVEKRSKGSQALKCASTSSVDFAEDMLDAQAEESYLLASSESALSSRRTSSHRTGRWTDEETDFVDLLVHAFDHGSLPMAAGVRLNDFLCSVLMCKASRLTKKMKNARLSMRVYQLKPRAERLDCEMLTMMQEKFLQSLEDEATRLELRFVMGKTWRQNIINLCLQVDYTKLETNAWVKSLDAMEKRAAEAKENIRKARRAQMGLTLNRDGAPPKSAAFDTRFQDHNPKQFWRTNMTYRDRGDSFASSTEASEHTKFVQSPDQNGHNETDSIASIDDFTNIFDDTKSMENFTNNSLWHLSDVSFLDNVISYIQSHNLPFEHVDVWVPSYAPNASREEQDFRLYHAGYATRNDIDQKLIFKFDEFGENNSKIIFSPGAGLPGRVFSSGRPFYECRSNERIDHASIDDMLSIKTGLGIPIAEPSVGNLVVVMYSVFDHTLTLEQIDTWISALTKFHPCARWKLKIEAENSGPYFKASRTSERSNQSSQGPAETFTNISGPLSLLVNDWSFINLAPVEVKTAAPQSDSSESTTSATLSVKNSPSIRTFKSLVSRFTTSALPDEACFLKEPSYTDDHTSMPKRVRLSDHRIGDLDIGVIHIVDDKKTTLPF
jgi:hypothetical protein